MKIEIAYEFSNTTELNISLTAYDYFNHKSQKSIGAFFQTPAEESDDSNHQCKFSQANDD